MVFRGNSGAIGPNRGTKRPFCLRTPSTGSKSVSLPHSPTISTSSTPPRSPSCISSSLGSSSTSGKLLTHLRRRRVPVDDTDGLTEQESPTTVEEIHLATPEDQYFSIDHLLTPPTPEQLRRRRKRKPRKLPYTFVRHRIEKSAKPEVFVDPRVQKRVNVDKSKWKTLSSVNVGPPSLNRDEYIMNIEGFKPVQVTERVYKPVIRRGRQGVYEKPDEGTGIGGYIIRFGDGHECCFSIDKLNVFVNRYPGLEELIEEFEHLSLAKEDGDRPAIVYFKRQKLLREEGAALDYERCIMGMPM